MSEPKGTLEDGPTNGYYKKNADEPRRINKRGVDNSQPSSKLAGGSKSSAKAASSRKLSNIESETDVSSSTRSRAIFESSTKKQPYFYYQNTTDSRLHFSLHSSPDAVRDGTSLDSNHGTTLILILFLHILFFYQWNTRRSRQEVCTSYDQLVDKKQFYRAAVAIVSHPPVDGGERDMNSFGTTNSHLGVVAMEGGGHFGSRDGPVERSSFFGRCVSCNLSSRFSPISRRMRPVYHHIHQRILHPLISGSLSGLPLLTFASHILWQCRALEGLYDDLDGKLILGVVENSNATRFAGIGTEATKLRTAGDAQNIDEHISSLDEGYSYFRVLVALAFTSVLLELSLLRPMLRRLDRYVDFDGYGTTPAQLLSQRAICSMASLSTALLAVYDSHFPYTPPAVLPFVRASFLSSSGFSLIFSILILALLTHRIHPVTSIMSGLLSGSLWSLGLTSFLGTRYWGNVMLFSLAFGMLLSLKAEPSWSKYLEIAIPCLDYVAWDRDGEISDGSASNNLNASRQNSVRERTSRSNIGDFEMDSHFQTQNGGYGSEERFPLFSSQSSSISGGSSSAIRGRVPRISTMDSDFDGADDLVITNNDESVPTASSRFGASLSRRGSGIQ